MDYQTRSLGAYASLKGLSAFHLAARHLPLRKRIRAISHLSGPFKTVIRGRGMEFEDVRLYQPGDDVRSIDWRVTARTGKAHTKQFREEKEKPVLLVIDQRQNMFFGSQKAMKSVLACDLAAFIAWAALHKGDRVGGLVFSDTSHQEVRPRRQRKVVLQLLHHLVEFNQALHNCTTIDSKRQPKGSLKEALKEIKRVAKPGTQIFFISDFHDLTDECAALLYDISRHCELLALQTYDVLETRLPKGGVYKASNGYQKLQFDTRNKKSREKYEREFATQESNIKSLFGKFRIPLIPIATSEAPLDVLQEYFGERNE